MYLEEKLINGVLCWRTSPKMKFRPYTLRGLSARYLALANELARSWTPGAI